jgi:hypothetical protein
MTMIELCFPVLGSQIPSDHGYALYSALVKTVSKVHDENCHVRIGSIAGTYVGKGTLQLDPVKSAKPAKNTNCPSAHPPFSLFAPVRSPNQGYRIRTRVNRENREVDLSNDTLTGGAGDGFTVLL